MHTATVSGHARSLRLGPSTHPGAHPPPQLPARNVASPRREADSGRSLRTKARWPPGSEEPFPVAPVLLPGCRGEPSPGEDEESPEQRLCKGAGRAGGWLEAPAGKVPLGAQGRLVNAASGQGLAGRGTRERPGNCPSITEQ